MIVDHFDEQTFTMEKVPVQVVGVVSNVRSTSLASESRETIYMPYAFSPNFPIVFVVRTVGDPTALSERVRAEVTALDPDVPMADVATLESYVRNAMSQTRFLLRSPCSRSGSLPSASMV